MKKSKLVIGISSRALFDLDDSHKIFEKEVRLKVKNQNPHLIKIKAMKKTTLSISPIKYEETPF